MRVRVRIRVHVTCGVLARGLTCVGRLSEQPHWRWPKQGAAVAKQGGLGELSGLCKVYRPKRRPAEGAVQLRPIMWPYSASVVLGSTRHLALAIFQQGIPFFGHCPSESCVRERLLYTDVVRLVGTTTWTCPYISKSYVRERLLYTDVVRLVRTNTWTCPVSANSACPPDIGPKEELIRSRLWHELVLAIYAQYKRQLLSDKLLK